MADAGVVRDANRLPWLEPYRAPRQKSSNRKPGLAAAIGTLGLAGIVAFLSHEILPIPVETPPPEAHVLLPAPSDLQPQIVLPPLHVEVEPATGATVEPQTRSAEPLPRRKIRAVPARAAYRDVMKGQAEPVEATPVVSEAALAIAAMPLPPDPPRPAVNPSAQVVRGKTVQLGVYLTQAQAEAAWKSAIKDYTYLVTMPKSIEAISLRSRRFYRLQLGTPSKRHAKQLCSNLKSIGRACTIA